MSAMHDGDGYQPDDWAGLLDTSPQNVTPIRNRRHGKPDAEPADEGPTTWEPVDLGPVLAGSYEPITPSLIHRTDGQAMMYAGRLNTFIGESESLKSFAANVGCVQQVQLGNTVVVVDLEDNEHTTTHRFLSLGLSADQIRRNVTYIHPERQFTFRAAEVVAEMLNAVHPTLVVIDSVAEMMALHGLDFKDAVDVVQFHIMARKFTVTGAGVAMIDHSVKDKESRGRWASGSERKISGIDGSAITVELRAPFGQGVQGGASLLKVAKDRPGGVRSFAKDTTFIGTLNLDSWPDGNITWGIRPPAEHDGPFRPTIVMDKVVQALSSAPQGLSKRALREQVGGKAETVDTAVELLINEGRIAASHERQSLVHRLIEPVDNP